MKQRSFFFFSYSSSFFSVLLLSGIVLFLFKESLPFLSSVRLSDIFFSSEWFPDEGKYGALALFIGTLFLSFGTLILLLPLGLSISIYQLFYASDFIRKTLDFILGSLAGIPSVVFGFWGIINLVPLLQMIKAPGTNILAGIIILTLMMIPTMALFLKSSFEGFSSQDFQQSLALGISKWRTITLVVLPSKKNGIIAAIILSLSRIVGETMAVMMVTGNIIKVPDSLFSPVRVLTANIALEMSYAVGIHRSGLFFIGFSILVFLFGMHFVFKFLTTQNSAQKA